MGLSVLNVFPSQLEYALPGTTAEAEAVLSAPPEKEVLRSWLPPQQLRREVTELLPDNLVPMLDPCLAKFYLSPIEVADPNYCVYFDNAEFQVKKPKPINPLPHARTSARYFWMALVDGERRLRRRNTPDSRLDVATTFGVLYISSCFRVFPCWLSRNVKIQKNTFFCSTH